VNIIRVVRYWKMVRLRVAAFVGKIQKVWKGLVGNSGLKK